MTEKKFKNGSLKINEKTIELYLKDEDEFEFNFKKNDLIEVNYFKKNNLINYMILVIGIISAIFIIGIFISIWAWYQIQNSKKINLITLGGTKIFTYKSDVYEELIKILN